MRRTRTPLSHHVFGRSTPHLLHALPLLLLLLAACSSDTSTVSPDLVGLSPRNAAANAVSVCHKPDESGRVQEIAGAALDAHLAHGDYVTTLVVDRSAPSADDGVHFSRITDALAAARDGRLGRGELTSAACRITIDVADGSYAGTTAQAVGGLEQFPLMVDVPDITLHGVWSMVIDAAGRATGTSSDGKMTVLQPVIRLPFVAGVNTPLIIANGHPDGSAGHGLIVEGFVLASGPPGSAQISGQGVLSLRVRDLIIRGNRFAGGFSESIDLRASSGDVTQNHLRGPGGSCDVCLAAPGTYRAVGNRIIDGGIPAITTSAVVGLPVPAGVEPYVLPETAEIWTEVRNNEVRDHLRAPVGVGIRVETVGTLAPNVRNTVHSVIEDNLISNNRFGIIIHAGFPVAGTLLTANADITLGNNTFETSCQAKLLVTFSRHQRTLGLNAALPYLQNSTYQLTLNGNLPWADVWFDHPAGRNNTLVVDGAPIGNGIRQFYSAATCPGI